MLPKTKINDLGPHLLWACPNCECEVHLHALEHVVTHILGGGSSLYLTCMTCEFEQRVPPQEDDLLRQASELHDKHCSGSIDHETYVDAVKALEASFISDLRTLTEEWSCPCGEVSPVSFVECWSCGALKPGFEIDESAVEESNVKPIDPRGGNAWEM